MKIQNSRTDPLHDNPNKPENPPSSHDFEIAKERKKALWTTWKKGHNILTLKIDGDGKIYPPFDRLNPADSSDPKKAIGE